MWLFQRGMGINKHRKCRMSRRAQCAHIPDEQTQESGTSLDSRMNHRYAICMLACFKGYRAVPPTQNVSVFNSIFTVLLTTASNSSLGRKLSVLSLPGWAFVCDQEQLSLALFLNTSLTSTLGLFDSCIRHNMHDKRRYSL